MKIVTLLDTKKELILYFTDVATAADFLEEHTGKPTSFKQVLEYIKDEKCVANKFYLKFAVNADAIYIADEFSEWVSGMTTELAELQQLNDINDDVEEATPEDMVDDLIEQVDVEAITQAAETENTEATANAIKNYITEHILEKSVISSNPSPLNEEVVQTPHKNKLPSNRLYVRLPVDECEWIMCNGNAVQFKLSGVIIRFETDKWIIVDNILTIND